MGSLTRKKFAKPLLNGQKHDCFFNDWIPVKCSAMNMAMQVVQKQNNSFSSMHMEEISVTVYELLGKWKVLYIKSIDFWQAMMIIVINYWPLEINVKWLMLNDFM